MTTETLTSHGFQIYGTLTNIYTKILGDYVLWVNLQHENFQVFSKTGLECELDSLEDPMVFTLLSAEVDTIESLVEIAKANSIQAD